MTNQMQRFVMWWRRDGWIYKFFTSLILGSLALSVVFTGIIMIPVGLIELLQHLTT